MTDSSEAERLRARVAELEAQVDTTRTPPTSRTKSGRPSGWWGLSSAILIILACVLAPLSVTSVWASTQLSDTEQYVETVAPLAEDPAVQRAVGDEVTAVVLENLDVKRITDETIAILAQQENVPPRVAAALPALSVPIVSGVESYAGTQVDNVLASSQFAAVWAQVNRIAHGQVVKLLEGNQGGAVSAQGDNVTLNLGPIVAQVKDRLVAQGFDLANNIPAVDRTFVLVQSDSIAQAQGFYSLLNTLGVWLPFVVLALFVSGVLLARDRRRALLKGALGIAAAMIVLGVALALARLWYVGATPANVLTEEAAGNVFDTLVRFLRMGLRATAILALIVALAAFITGPSNAAVRTRGTLVHGIGSARGSAEAAGWNAGRVGTWTHAHKQGLRICLVIAAGLVLVFWTRPTGSVVVVTALIVVLVLALIEFLARPPVQQVSAAAGTGGTDGTGTEDTAALPRQMQRTSSEAPSETPSAQPASEKQLHGAEKGPHPNA